MSVREIEPQETTRASAFELWMKVPNPMVTFFKTYDVMPLINKSRSTGMKFNLIPLEDSDLYRWEMNSAQNNNRK